MVASKMFLVLRFNGETQLTPASNVELSVKLVQELMLLFWVEIATCRCFLMTGSDSRVSQFYGFVVPVHNLLLLRETGLALLPLSKVFFKEFAELVELSQWLHQSWFFCFECLPIWFNVCLAY